MGHTQTLHDTLGHSRTALHAGCHRFKPGPAYQRTCGWTSAATPRVVVVPIAAQWLKHSVRCPPHRDLVALGMGWVTVRAWGLATVCFVALSACGGKAIESSPSPQDPPAQAQTVALDAGGVSVEQSDAGTYGPYAGLRQADGGTCSAPASVRDAGSGDGCSVQAVPEVNGEPACSSLFYGLHCVGVGSLQPDPSLKCKAVVHSYPAGVLDWCCPCAISDHIK
jgi:hypothetical protein